MTSALVKPASTPPPARAELERLRKLAWLLDAVIEIPVLRWRFGLDAVVGLIPGVGDLFGGLTSAYIVFRAARLGASASVLLRMMVNIGVETLVGAVPAVGDLFDAAFKANLRNIALLERHLVRPTETRRASRRMLWLLAAAVGVLLLAAIIVTVVIAVLVIRAVAQNRGPIS